MALLVEELRAGYGNQVVLPGINVQVAVGAALALTGPNGSGKSTLLRCLAGRVPCEYARFMLMGASTTPSSSVHWARVHTVLDDGAWYPQLTVADHLALLVPRGMTPQSSRELVKSALKQMGIEEMGDRIMSGLSSGQARRAALATLLVRSWDVVLLDEPEQHLDDSGVNALAAMLAQQLARGRSIVFSTHSSVLMTRMRCPSISLA